MQLGLSRLLLCLPLLLGGLQKLLLRHTNRLPRLLARKRARLRAAAGRWGPWRRGGRGGSAPFLPLPLHHEALHMVQKGLLLRRRPPHRRRERCGRGPAAGVGREGRAGKRRGRMERRGGEGDGEGRARRLCGWTRDTRRRCCYYYLGGRRLGCMGGYRERGWGRHDGQRRGAEGRQGRRRKGK